MTRWLYGVCWSVVFVLVVGCAAQRGNTPRAVSVPARVTAAYGGQQWRMVRYLRYDLAVRHRGEEVARYRHLWDRGTGLYRYEADAGTFATTPMFDETTGTWQPLGLPLPKGRLVGLVNRRDFGGAVYIDGWLQDSGLIRRVLERIDNDTFLLLQPLELANAGTVGKTYSIRRSDDSKAMVYRFRYPQTAGTTPDDLWALFIDPRTMHIYQSRVKPQGVRKVVAAQWNRLATVNGITFCLERRMADKRLVFEKITMPREVPLEVFTDPTVPMPW